MNNIKKHCLTNSNERSQVTDALEELAGLVGMRFVLDEQKVQNINSIKDDQVFFAGGNPSKD